MASVGKYNVSQMQLIFYFILSILKYTTVYLVTMLKHVMVILNYITKYYAQY